MTEMNCPTCQKTIEYSKQNPFRPFCSKRCQLIDLGEWASESHKIGGKSAHEEMFSEELEQMIKDSLLK
ncbi:DNA gyrase inhibitor YacG [Reinekea thalattae]|uniref:DNA gyrase inhibitor YacG n=1 Tax=Reinekea thalattae TaxID=2593301 RepID=A0A5C8Z521_9GAMM|nr:DNA gyrase inhibitor YacG [Reinekea thalattae]TXR52006.1 DNA gyrase inhibitor YacG [Reinekea thalattae]